MKKLLSFLLVFTFTLCVFAKIPKNYIPVNPDMRQLKLINFSREKNEYKFKNVCWGYDKSEKANIYKDTTVKLGNVKEVYYVSEKFPPEWLAAHGMLALIMKDNNSVICEDGKKSRGIILSVEAWRDKGVPYDIKTGLFKNFKLIFMIYTFEGRLDISCGKRNDKLELVKININSNQKNQLLENVIKESLIDKSKIYYNTLTESCVTNCAKMINTVLTKKRRLHLWTIPKILPNIRVSMPVFLTNYFVKKKIGTRVENVMPKTYKKFLALDFYPAPYTESLENIAIEPDKKIANIQRLAQNNLIESVEVNKTESISLTLEQIEELKAKQDCDLIDKLIEMHK